ncbi:sensor histidine kinase [Sulfurimonas paralvinellae]|uniref:Sensor histidine kinase n=1 Tax=Sulfurimonas paralvinellae TaxID=317658 RepID=A0A7M1B801_9BACT|nr:ATP-binding protein [Sulfurimonas paralvinellae]QOP45867.1 sensor histidine kinase [Sulfurimonas paralvinellae]
MSTKWEDVHFLSHVNIKNIIGKELINDDNVAVMELVKNSYDAGASKVDVEFKNLKSVDTLNHEIIISDNGKGMSKEDILQKWLNLAYSIKRVQNAQNNRLQAGNKGIGRFSCDRLGKKLNIFTKQTKGKIYQLQINWEDFENIEDYSVEINQIPMKLREVSMKEVFDETNYKINTSGTIVQIVSLRTKWIKINQNSLFNEVLNYQKFSTLKASLEKLINKSQVDSGGFKIHLHVKEIEDKNETAYYKKINGEITNKFFDKLNFDTTYIQSVISEDGTQIITQLKDRDKVVFKTIEKNTEFPDLKGVKIILMYLNPYAKAYFQKQMQMRSVEFGSVYLFINGFRIPPYGDIDNDAFGMEVRKNQGRSRYLSNREVIGRIEIEDRDEQYHVISSREGIVHNEKFKQLIHVSTKSTTAQKKNNGFFYKTLKRLERYVVNGIRWDSVSKEYTESYIRELTFSKNWNKDKEVYLLSEEEKKKNISKNIFKIIGIDAKDSLDINIDDKILLYLLEEKENLLIQKNITKFLKEFSKLPQSAISNDLKKFVKKVYKIVADKRLTNKITFLISKKNTNELIDDVIDKEESYKELDKKILVLKNSETKLKKELEAAKLKNKKKDEELTYLKTVQSKDVKELIAFQHHIGLYTKTAKDCILDVVDMLNKNTSINDEVYEYLKDASFELDKISLINKYITKEDFLSTASNVTKDLVKFIDEYIRNIYEITTNKELIIEINTNNLQYICSFEPIKVNIIIDNLLNNSKKAKAKNVTLNFIKTDEHLEIEYIDDGLGLDNTIIAEDSIFEMGVTTTKGSGLGLYHIKEILEEMNQSTINVYKLDTGIKFLLRLKL